MPTRAPRCLTALTIFCLAAFMITSCAAPTALPANPTPQATSTTLPSATATQTFTPLPATPTPTPTRIPATATPDGPTPTITPIPLSELATPLVNDGYLKSFTTSQNFVVLTIDDGYFKLETTIMLDTLDENHGHATFFLVGNAVKYILGEEVTRRIASSGHEIAYHSFFHQPAPELAQWKKEDWIKDYDQWSAYLREVLGADLYAKAVKPYARAPYGQFTRAFLDMCKEKRLTPVGWNASATTLDQDKTYPPGSIVLLHARLSDLKNVEKIFKLEPKVVDLGEALGNP